jgi:predicted enzyme related to lactoylglutathione lyase
MQRAFTNILCRDPGRTATFYEGLLGMTRHADFGWFVVLSHADMPSLEFGLLDRGHETVPQELAAEPAGVILTFVVEDVHLVHDRAVDMAVEILDGPTDLPYGQRRLLLRDPEGTLIDISSPTPPGES